MAGSDPKKMRAAAAADRRNFDAEEDPLVELARIVSEDSGFSAPRNERQRAVHREERIDRNAFSADLEAELLQELESSFATRAAPAPATSRSAPPPTRNAPVPVAPVAETSDAADDADDLLRSIEEQLGQFERSVQLDVSPEPERSQPAYAAVAAEPEPVEAVNLDEPFDTWSEEAAHKFDDQRDYRFRGPAGVGRARDYAERDHEGYSDQAESRFEEEQLETAETRGYADFDAPQSHDPAQHEGEPDSGEREWRATAAQAARERRASQVDHDEPREDIDLSGVEAGLSRELESDYADPTYPADSGEWDRPADRASEEARLAVTTLPGNGAWRARSSRGWGRSLMLTAASVIAVVLVAGAAAMFFQAGDDGASGPPPLITAEEGEVKIQPPQAAEAAAEPETAGEAVYDRVAGNAPATDGEIVDSAEEPREIARIILPPSQTPDTGEGVRQVDPNAPVVAESGEAAAPETPAEDEIGPRRVPTYVIRPDGTIVTTAEAGVSEPTTAVAPPVDIAAQTEAIEPISVPTTSIGPDGASSPGAPPAAEATPPAPAEPTPAPAIAEAPAPAEPQAPADGASALEIAGVPVEPVQPVAPAPEPEQPVNLLGDTAAVDPAPTPAPPPTASAGYLVQISSQRSEAAAQSSFNDMQGRFASILGSLSPDIQQADLGDRGIYFRVRVGPWATRAEAIQVCEALKAAGGDCIVTQ